MCKTCVDQNFLQDIEEESGLDENIMIVSVGKTYPTIDEHSMWLCGLSENGYRSSDFLPVCDVTPGTNRRQFQRMTESMHPHLLVNEMLKGTGIFASSV